LLSLLGERGVAREGALRPNREQAIVLEFDAHPRMQHAALKIQHPRFHSKEE
jgi:hypothetical protein